MWKQNPDLVEIESPAPHSKQSLTLPVADTTTSYETSFPSGYSTSLSLTRRYLLDAYGDARMSDVLCQRGSCDKPTPDVRGRGHANRLKICFSLLILNPLASCAASMTARLPPSPSFPPPSACSVDADSIPSLFPNFLYQSSFLSPFLGCRAQSVQNRLLPIAWLTLCSLPSPSLLCFPHNQDRMFLCDAGQTDWWFAKGFLSFPPCFQQDCQEQLLWSGQEEKEEGREAP